MRIADTHIPMVHPTSTWSNVVYLGFIPLVITLSMPAAHATTIAVAGAALAFSSALFHATPDEALWGQRMDAWAILAVLSALLGAGVTEAVGVHPSITSAAAIAASAAWWYQLHRVRRNVVIGIYVVALTACSAVVAGWAALVPIGVLGVAYAVRTIGPNDAHGKRHPWWHLLSAAGLALFPVIWYLS